MAVFNYYSNFVSSLGEPLITVGDEQFMVRGVDDGGIILRTYISESQPNTIGKSLRMYTEIDEYGYIVGVLRDEVSILDPIITIECDTFPKFNYVRIDEFNRYYFVNDIIVVRKNLYELYLSVDVLETYRSLLNSVTGFVDRAEDFKDEGSMLIDKKRIVGQGQDIEVLSVDRYEPNGEFVDVFITDFTEQGTSTENPTTNFGDYMYVINGYKLSQAPPLG